MQSLVSFRKSVVRAQNFGGQRHRVATSPQNSTQGMPIAQGQSIRSASRNMTSTKCKSVPLGVLIARPDASSLGHGLVPLVLTSKP